MKKQRILIPIIIIVVVFLLASFFIVKLLMSKPLGPTLVNDLGRGGKIFQNTKNISESTPLPGVSPQANITSGPPLCGSTSVLTILLTGIDYRGDNYLYGLADVIRIVRIDFTIPKISVFALDRDIWVEIPDIQEHYGITHGKLNQSYFYGVPAMGYYDGRAGGAGLLAKTLNLNFGLQVDNYIVVSMAAFTKGVDALGGIDVNLPQPLDSKDAEIGAFPAGLQHLDGSRALQLARLREGYSSLIRISNQDLIIQALQKKILSPEIILKVPGLISALKGTVLTDLSPNQINDMICLANKMDTSTISFAEIPTDFYHQSSIYDPSMKNNVFIWDIDFNIIRAYVNEFQNGRWP